MTEVFIPHALERREDPTKPILLIYDGHGSHESLELREALYKTNIADEVILMALPSKTTHKTQPLDVVVFSHLQRKWQDHCSTSAIRKRHIDRHNVIDEYLKVRSQCINSDLIKKAFEKTGIFPFNPNVFTDEDFAPSRNTSTRAHVPASFPPEFPSSDGIEPPSDFQTETDSDEEDDPDYDPDGQRSDGSGEDDDPMGVDSNDENDDDPESAQSDDTHFSNGEHNDANSPRLTRSLSAETSFISAPSPSPPALHSLIRDQSLTPDERLAEIRALRCQQSDLWQAIQYWKAQAFAGSAHCTLIKRELALAKLQVANLEKKRTRRTGKEKARILVHKKYKASFMEELEAELKSLLQRAGREAAQQAWMSTEVKERIFDRPLSSYKKREDLVILARVLNLSEAGKVVDIRQRLQGHLKAEQENLAGNPRFAGLFSRSQRRGATTSTTAQATPAPSPYTQPPLSTPTQQTQPALQLLPRQPFTVNNTQNFSYTPTIHHAYTTSNFSYETPPSNFHHYPLYYST
ncbi:hypothetical protein CC2G_015303 [Coprinopsis cinerea AmutBmut pab1-1]|nr:hypothetical protein CC2G_015303 [Coprinopsis cinerea AmutBmut pab1-1]